MRYLACLLLLLSACTPLKYEQYAEVKALQGSPDRSTIDRYLLTQYKGQTTERIRVIYLRDGVYLKDEKLGSGYRDKAFANSIEVVAHCTLAHCNEVLLAHNHPNLPYAEPSDMDIYTAARLSKFLLGTDIDLVASIIVSDNDTAWIFL
jgi:DNA repair protein RadC